MKFQTLPVKRRPVQKGILRRLSAVTRNKKQRVSAATADPSAEMDMDDGGSKISRALTIIFLIHIVAIGLIFIHKRFLDGHPVEKSEPVQMAVTPVAKPDADLPRLSAGEKPYFVKPGDNYTRIAAAEGVDESELARANGNVEIKPGLLLRIPPKRIVAVEPPEVTAIREQTPSDADRGIVENEEGLVDAVDVTNAPKAPIVRPAITHTTQSQTIAQPVHRPTTQQAPAPTTSGKSYTVQPGDSVWRIANRFKINQDRLMRANGISDAKKMKTGMKLVIPQN